MPINKKAQTSVITVVLLVLVGIIAISILAVFIIHTVRENTSQENINVDLSIDPTGTFYDDAVSTAKFGSLSEQSNNVQVIYIKVKSNTDNSRLSGLKFVFNTAGNSVVCTTTNIPGMFESRTYKYIAQKPDFIEMAPVVNVNGKEKTLVVMDKINIKAIDKNTNILDPRIVNLDSCSSSGLPEEKINVK